VSDPGYRLVEEIVGAGAKVVPIPGPSALLAGLTASALPSDTFLFAGFLPVKAGRRQARLAELAAVPATLIFSDSPRRSAEALAAMQGVLGDRPAAVCRELTKAFEEVRRGSLANLAEAYAQEDTPKGEIVICVGPPAAVEASEADVDAMLLALSAEMGASK